MLKLIVRLSVATILCGVTFIPITVAAERTEKRVIEEILVVSTKRAKADESQIVPIASTVVSSEMINENNFYDLVEVARMVPGADFNQTATFPGIQRFWMRAVGVSFSTPNFDPAVGVYQDGVFIAQNIAAILDTFDMESIEILRGPQGTLFGRNTSVGAVSSRSRRPTNERNFRLQGTVGEFDRTDISASISGPIIEDKLLGKVSVQSRKRDGWMKDLGGGSDVGEIDTTHFRGTLVYEPTDNFDLTLIGEYYERGGDGAIAAPLGLDNNGTSNHPLLPGKRSFDETWSTGDNAEPFGTFSDHEVKKFIVEANWDLGHGVLTSVSGLVDVVAFSGSDFDGLPTNSLQVVTRLMIDQDQFSQEIRYASSFSDKFDFTVGAYYFTQDLEYGEQRCCTTKTVDNPFGMRPPGYDLLDHDAWALFAEGRFNLSDKLILSLGGRYTEETKDVKMGLVNYGSCDAALTGDLRTSTYFVCSRGAVGGFDIQDDETWTSFSPKIGLQYLYNDDVMLFTSATRGFRSGGFSFRAGGAELSVPGIRPAFYDEEQVDSYELGVKSDLFENRLRLNVNTYYQDWEGIQRNLQEGAPGNIVQRTANVKESHVYGVELEMNAIAGLDMLLDGDSLRVDLSVGRASSGYDSNDYVIRDPNTLEIAVDLTGQEFGGGHNTTFVGLTYDHPVGSRGATISWHGTYYWKEGWWTEGVHRPTGINKYDDRNIVDASVQYTSADGKWYVKFFGKNLTDDENYAALVPFADSFGLGNPEDPKVWGLTFGLDI
jgi:iron complex outermembrane recepter protein